MYQGKLMKKCVIVKVILWLSPVMKIFPHFTNHVPFITEKHRPPAPQGTRQVAQVSSLSVTYYYIQLNRLPARFTSVSEYT